VTAAVLAHGFGIRYDLPVPLQLYLGAAAAVVILSFVLVIAFVRGGAEDLKYPRLRLDDKPMIGRLVRGPAPRVVGGPLGVLVLVSIIVTGLLGASDATDNPAEYLMWIYSWPLLLILSSLAGNVWTLVNPWAALYDGAAHLAGRTNFRPLREYPRRFGLWPAVLGYVVFAFFELASGQSANPRSVAAALLVYTVYVLAMVVVFGRGWLEQGEAITVLYRFVGAFGPVEVEEGKAGRHVFLRPWAVGITRLRLVGWDVVTFVVLMLASLAFDGVESTPLWASIYNAAGGLMDALGPAGPPTVKLLGLLGVTAIFGILYVVFIWLVLRAGREWVDLGTAGTLFAFTLIPIALVYFAAHFYTYVIIQSQGLVPLLADPLHTGAHLLPTAGYKPSFALTDARFVWYLQVFLIVAGHIVAVYLAHLRALATYGDHRAAQRSQYPMLLLMVLYTCMSLWILAQPNVEAG